MTEQLAVRPWWRTGGRTRIRVTAVAVATAALSAAFVAAFAYSGMHESAARALSLASTTQLQGVAELLRASTLPAGYVSGLPYEVSTEDGEIIATSGDYQREQVSGAIGAGSWSADRPETTAQITTYEETSFTIAGQDVDAIDTYVAMGPAQAQASGRGDGELVRLVVFEPSSWSEGMLGNARSALALSAGTGLLVSGVAVWFGVGAALRPIAHLRGAVERIRQSPTRSARVGVPEAGDEVQQLAVTLNSLLAERAELEQRQQDFISDAAHELRSPVASLLTTLEVANQYPDSVDYEVSTASALRQARRLRARVDELLLLASFEADSVVRLETLSPESVIRGVLAHARVDDALDAVTDIEPSDATLSGSRGELERAFGNLLTNASRHAVSRVWVRSHVVASAWVVEIGNDGPEIPSADRERIFDRFVRLDTARPHSTSTGLGLPIARKIFERHRGAVSVSSSPETTIFTVMLPVDSGSGR